MPYKDAEARRAYGKAYRARPSYRAKIKEYTENYVARDPAGARESRLRAQKKHRIKNRAHLLACKRIKRTGVSPEDFLVAFEAQEHCCGICSRRLHYTREHNRDIDHACADHCHASGRFRGVLCVTCNSALGSFKDDPYLLMQAAAWVCSNA